MTLNGRRILSSRNWPLEVSRPRETMAGRGMHRRSQGEFPGKSSRRKVLADGGAACGEKKAVEQISALPRIRH